MTFQQTFDINKLAVITGLNIIYSVNYTAL